MLDYVRKGEWVISAVCTVDQTSLCQSINGYIMYVSCLALKRVTRPRI